MGHGQDLPAGEFRAMDEDKAFDLAFRACERFQLPGWVLRCAETGTALPVVKFSGPVKDDALQSNYAKSARRVTKRL